MGGNGIFPLPQRSWIVTQRENQPHRVLTPLRGTQSSGRAPSPPSTFPGQRFPSRDRLESRRESPGPASTRRSPSLLPSQRGSLESTRSPRPLLGANSEGQLGVRAQIPTLGHSWSTAGFNRHTRGTGTAGMTFTPGMLTPGMRAPGPASQSPLSLSSHPSLSSFPSISLPHPRAAFSAAPRPDSGSLGYRGGSRSPAEAGNAGQRR